MKLAVIVHTTERGGAAISNTTNLNYYLENCLIVPNEIRLVLPKQRGINFGMYSVYRGRIPITTMRLPFSWTFVGAAKGIQRKVYRMYGEISSITTFLLRYNKFFVREGITSIYLNSAVLWSLLPVLPQHLKLTIHIRESFDNSLESRVAIWTIRHFADTIIAINSNVAKPFEDLFWKLRIIENPINMKSARQLRNVRDELKSKTNLPKESFIVSLFSPIGYQKGYDFLIEVLNELKDYPEIIVIGVGNIDNGSQKLLDQILLCKNFQHFAQRDVVDDLYAVTDIVLRCEDYLPIGRTVFEGIYAGCMVLLPIVSSDSTTDLKSYSDQVYLYPARDKTECAGQIIKLYQTYKGGIVDNGFAPTGNVKESSEQILDIIKN